jgi:hypothetical protein
MAIELAILHLISVINVPQQQMPELFLRRRLYVAVLLTGRLPAVGRVFRRVLSCCRSRDATIFSPGDMLEHARSNQRRQHKRQQHRPRINRKAALFHWSRSHLSLIAHLVSPLSLMRKNKPTTIKTG